MIFSNIMNFQETFYRHPFVRYHPPLALAFSTGSWISVLIRVCVVLGDVESTMPTKLLMETAAYVDTHSTELKEWFLNCKEEVLALLADQNDTKMAAPTSHE